MRCKCCDSILGNHYVVRQVLVPRKDDPSKKETLRIEEDMCRKCIIASSPDLSHGDDSQDDISLLPLDIPFRTVDYYEDSY